MKNRRRRRYAWTFEEKQRALLFALLAVALLDFIVSAFCMREFGRETTAQMLRLVEMHTQQVYSESTRISSDMQRLLMENQDLTGLAVRGTRREQIYAKGRLKERISYSLGNEQDYRFFFYFEDTNEVLSCSWLDTQSAKERGITGTVLEKIRTDGELTIDLFRWDNFAWEDTCYLLRAYRYNNVWFVGYVPAERMVLPLQESFADSDCRVILQSNDKTVLFGQDVLEEWDITEKMLAEGGTFYKSPVKRIEIVREVSEDLELCVAVVMRGYGGFLRIILLQAAILFLVLVTLGAFVLMTVYTRQRIIAPVQKFVKGVQNYQDGTGREELSVCDIHELEQINEQFRRFVHQIGALKIDIYEEKIRRQKLETDNLKLQLKPHFFLNSLGVICRFLETGRIADARRMCMAIIRYLRYLFSVGMDGVPLSEAIAHMDDYLEMMRLRDPGGVEIDVYVEDAVRGCVIPPLLIQTLVENSFKYGKKAEQVLEISVTAMVEQRKGARFLCINVSDNGDGYPPEYLQIWKDDQDLEQEEGRHIGIANIRARLAWAYQGEAVMELYNSPLQGAVTEVFLPLTEGSAECRKG